jgi:hypothetical protein
MVLVTQTPKALGAMVNDDNDEDVVTAQSLITSFGMMKRPDTRPRNGCVHL